MQQDTAESVRVLLRYKKPYKGEHCQTVHIYPAFKKVVLVLGYLFSLCRASDTTKATLSNFDLLKNVNAFIILALE